MAELNEQTLLKILRDFNIANANYSNGSNPYDDTIQAILALHQTAVVEELEDLKTVLPDHDTDCLEDHINGNNGCDPIDHARRDGRWRHLMESCDLIDARIFELKAPGQSVINPKSAKEGE